MKTLASRLLHDYSNPQFVLGNCAFQIFLLGFVLRSLISCPTLAGDGSFLKEEWIIATDTIFGGVSPTPWRKDMMSYLPRMEARRGSSENKSRRQRQRQEPDESDIVVIISDSDGEEAR